MDINLNTNLQQSDNNNKIAWTCEKCQNMNLLIDFRCLKCNYFNYDVYSGKYKKSNLIEDENKSHKKNKLNKPIILKDKFIDYNYKENYEFKRQEKHKFIKCWKCGRENIYYKVKCNNCRFTIHDEQIPKIKKTQLSQYDVIHNIPIINDDKKMNEPDEENKFKEIKIKYNSPIKENIKYKSLENNWKCKFCKKINKETIKYCQFCFKNRL